MILTLSSLPGTREKTLEIFPGGLFEKDLSGVGCRENCFFFFKFCQLTLLSQVCMYFKDQQVVFSYSMISHMVPATIMTPYIYPMGHRSH